MLRIVHSSHRNMLKSFSSLPWVYIGGHKGLESACYVLKSDKRIFLAKEIGTITDAVRDRFVDYIGKLSQKQSDRVLWYSSRMATKSITQTSIFQQYVYLKLIEKCINQRKNDELLIVTDDEELIQNIKSVYAQETDVLTRVSSWKSIAYEKVKGYVRIMRYCLLWLLCKCIQKRNVKAYNVFLHSWIDARVFSTLPKYNDVVFGDLERFLQSKRFSVARLAPLRAHVRHMCNLKRHFKNVVFPLAYLTFRDLLKGIFTRFCVSFNSDGTGPTEDDAAMLEYLVRQETVKENDSKIFLDYLLLFYAYKSFSLAVGKNTSFIYPFENQPWEKMFMFNLAFARFNRIGYMREPTIVYNWLDYRVSHYENDDFLPPTILTTGKRWSSFFRQYYSSPTIEEAGTLGYPNIFRNLQQVKDTAESKRIILALPNYPIVSVSLQKCLLRVLSQNRLQGYNIIVKPHPYSAKSLRLKKEFSKYENCVFVETSLEELLRDCALFVTSHTTAVVVPICLGIKTLYFIPECFSWGVEYFIQEHLFLAHEEDFLERFQEALTSNHYPRAEKKEHFPPPDYDVFLKHLRKS